jgi:hypothetical protein
MFHDVRGMPVKCIRAFGNLTSGDVSELIRDMQLSPLGRAVLCEDSNIK